MCEPLYSVATWDSDRQDYTPQHGLSVPSFNITLSQLRQAMRELKSMGYPCHRIRSANGEHENNDWAVLVERTDGKHWKEIRLGWDRHLRKQEIVQCDAQTRSTSSPSPKTTASATC